MGSERRLNDWNGVTDLLSDEITVESSSPSRSLLSTSSPPSDPVGIGVNGGLNYIIHTVSKYDTLAGVAIKYGVEVADIKRLNGLMTDLQMFALKTLQIPLPGRHPPSPILYNCHDTPERPSSSEHTPSNRRHSDIFDSFQSLRLNYSPDRKVSPAMSSLQGYYGLKPSDQTPTSEGFEMSVYLKEGPHSLEDKPTNPPLSHHRKSRPVLNFGSENGFHNPLLSPQSENGNSDRWFEKLLRRRQKSVSDFNSRTPEKLLKEENTISSVISAITGKGLALRPKSANRTVSGGVDGESSGSGPISIGSGDSAGVTGVRKSSSLSSLQDSENSALASIWPTSRWNLKPDFQALSNSTIARPIFDGLPKPTGRKNKAALD